MIINKKLIRYNHVKNTNKPTYIVIHDTANKSVGANAEMHYKYFNGGNRSASAHYFVDDKQILQLVEDKDTAWHVGDGSNKYGINNQNSIGIEICVNSDGNYKKAFNTTIDLVIDLMNKYNIPLEKVVRHYDASRKNCPASMAGNNWELWTSFKKLLKDSQVEEWKIKDLKELNKAGIVSDYEAWIKKIDEPAPNWLVFILMNRIRKELMKK